MREASSCLRRLAALAALTLAACVSPVPQRSGEWLDPAVGANSGLLRGEKVMVACEALDLSMRQNCQAWLLHELQVRGANPVAPLNAATPASGRELDNQLMVEAARAGARAVLVVGLTPAVMGGGFSGASIGIGGFSWGGSGGAGIGLSAPIGGTGWGGTGFAAQGRIIKVPDGRLVWSTSFVASPSSAFDAQVRDLAIAVVNAAQGAGLL